MVHALGMALEGLVLCADIGATSTKFGVASSGERVEVVGSIPTRGPGERFAEAMCESLEATRRGVDACILGLGVAVAGFLDERRERMIYNSNLPWLEDYPLEKHLASELNLPVGLEVDSNAAALAEQQLGTGRGSARFLCLTVGTGLGVGMIVDGEPLRFAYGCMGDAGHIIVERDGPLCSCGGRGCAEILVSAPVLAEQYGVPSLREVIEAARGGDAIAIALLERAGEWLGDCGGIFGEYLFPGQDCHCGRLCGSRRSGYGQHCENVSGVGE